MYHVMPKPNLLLQDVLFYDNLNFIPKIHINEEISQIFVKEIFEFDEVKKLKKKQVRKI